MFTTDNELVLHQSAISTISSLVINNCQIRYICSLAIINKYLGDYAISRWFILVIVTVVTSPHVGAKSLVGSHFKLQYSEAVASNSPLAFISVA
jgi:hypothetical protein